MTEPLDKLPEERLGDFLVRAREARGLSREELSEDTHVSKSYLEWMETGDWKKFPVDAYLRSYLNSVSVRLALDPKKVLEWYAKERGMVSKENFVAPPMSNEQFAVSQEKGKSKARPIIVGVILVAILLALLYVMNLPKNDSTLPVEKEPSQEPIISEDTAETPAPILEGAESISLDSVLKEDSIAALKARQLVDSVAKEKELPASATLFLSSGSKASEDSLQQETKKEKVGANSTKTTIEFMASGNEETWIGIKKQAEGENFLRQGKLSLAGARFAYSGTDTLYVIIGNPVAIASMSLNGEKTSLPSGVSGRSLRFRVLGKEIFRGF